MRRSSGVGCHLVSSFLYSVLFFVRRTKSRLAVPVPVVFHKDLVGDRVYHLATMLGLKLMSSNVHLIRNYSNQ